MRGVCRASPPVNPLVCASSGEPAFLHLRHNLPPSSFHCSRMQTHDFSRHFSSLVHLSSGVAKTSRWAGFLGNFARRSPSISTSPSLPPSLPASSLGPLSAATMAPPSTLSPAAQKKKDAVAAYVKSRGGNLGIRKVLIANNG